MYHSIVHVHTMTSCIDKFWPFALSDGPSHCSDRSCFSNRTRLYDLHGTARKRHGLVQCTWHWDRGKMTAILQTLNSIQEQASIGSDDGLVPNRRQAIVWAYMHHAALNHWGRTMHIFVNKLTINQAIIWTNDGILVIGPLGINFSEI